MQDQHQGAAPPQPDSSSLASSQEAHGITTEPSDACTMETLQRPQSSSSSSLSSPQPLSPNSGPFGRSEQNNIVPSCLGRAASHERWRISTSRQQPGFWYPARKMSNRQGMTHTANAYANQGVRVRLGRAGQGVHSCFTERRKAHAPFSLRRGRLCSRRSVVLALGMQTTRSIMQRSLQWQHNLRSVL